MSVVIIFQSHK